MLTTVLLSVMNFFITLALLALSFHFAVIGAMTLGLLSMGLAVLTFVGMWLSLAFTDF